MTTRAVTLAALAAAALAFAAPVLASTTAVTEPPISPLGPISAQEPARLTEDEATRTALDHPKVSSWLARYPADPTTSARFRSESRTWVVKVWSGDAGQIVQAVVEDTSGRVSEGWTGPQVAWKMARGREGAFGGKTLNKLYVWLAFCLVFLVGLADLRRPPSLRNVDLLALLAFSVSLAFFNRGEIFRSVPLAYPPLLYLLARSARSSGCGRARRRPYRPSRTPRAVPARACDRTAPAPPRAGSHRSLLRNRHR